MHRFTRRDALVLLTGFVSTAGLEASGGDFWNKKAPSEWSAEEDSQLLNKSPWAKEVTAQFSGGGQRGGGGGFPGGGMGGPRIGIGGIGMPRGRMGGGRGRGGGPGQSSYKGVVRWESAQPIREA